MKRLVKIAGFLISSSGFAQSHNIVNSYRSGTVNHLFVSQSTAFEVGRVDFGEYRETFQGLGVSTVTGTELMKFVQVSAGHTFVSLRNKRDTHERLLGSRIKASLGLVFGSPVGNLEFGGGFVGGKYDYINKDSSGEMYTRGGECFIGVNYFLSSQISVFIKTSQDFENAADASGVSILDKFKYDSSAASLGFSIWL